MDLSALPLNMFSEKLVRHVVPDAPPQLRMMAARGLVPAAPNELLGLLYQLSFDADESVARSAKNTLESMPEDVITPAASAPNHPMVLYRLAEIASKKHSLKLLEAVLRNNHAPDDAFVTVARTCNESFSELIAANEVRVLRCPRIIESLFMNEHARQSTIDRLLDLARRNKVSFTELPALQALIEDQRYDTAAEAKAAGTKDDRFKKQLERSKAEEAEEQKLEATLSEDELIALREKQQEEEGEHAAKSKNKQAEIGNMSISEKMRLAMLGSSADRDLLIKDGNRLVHMAAATSPKATLKDVVAWSMNKQIPDNVISYIANHQRYRRLYKIIVNLSNNPKTPFAIATKIVPSLHTKDLGMLVKNRNSHPMVRRFAKNIADQREKKR
jgi:hypothetical protein